MKAGKPPLLTVIVPHPPGVVPTPVLRSLLRNGGPYDIQLLAVEGRQPSWQRNLAVQSARAPLVLFLDHDSEILPATIGEHLKAMRDGKVGAAGGPNLSSAHDGRFGTLASLVLGSPLGSPLVWRRYRGGKSTDRGDEKSLILCNLSVRRGAFLECGGFDPRLYPNEENEFLDRLQSRGWRATYSPRMAVEKPRPARLRDFARENARNGRGRLEQAWVNPHFGDAVFLGVLAGGLGVAVAAWFTGSLPWVASYATVTVVEGFRLAVSGPGRRARARNGVLVTSAACVGLIALRHAAYFGGMVAGALTGWRKRKLRIPPLRMTQREYRMRGGKCRQVEGRRTTMLRRVV